METKTVLAYQVSIVKDRVNAMNYIASKLGLPPVVLTVVKTYEKLVSVLSGETCWVSEIAIEGELPRINGWRFLAQIEHTANGNLIKKMPGCDIELAAYHNCKPNCEHCNINRNRNVTYLLKNESGEIKQVGSTCLQDFTRCNDVVTLLRFVESNCMDEFDYDSEGGFFCSGGRGYSPIDWVTAAYASIRVRGYIKSDDEQGRKSTKYHVRFLLDSRKTDFKTEEAFEKAQPNEQDREKAQAAIDWTKTQKGHNDYQHNLKVCASGFVVEPSMQGVLSSLPIAYDRWVEEQAGKKTNPGHYGMPKDKMVAEVEIKRMYGTTGVYGNSKAVVMVATTGHRFIAYTTSDEIMKMTDTSGKWFLYGTVKKHTKNRDNEAETVLTRIVLRRDYVKVKGHVEVK
jgi:hypothetical protein